MSKINNKQRLEIYHKRKQGETIANLSKQYQLNRANIEYLIRLLDRHGEQILRQGRNRYYSPELKQEIIDKVLIEHRSLISTSIEYGLSNSGILSNWIKVYKENCYRIVEKRKGRKPAMKKNAKSIDPKDKDAIIKQKDEEIVAYDISKSPNFEQTINMLDRAFEQYEDLEGLILHSDQGWQGIIKS